jgi:hypothetical protein
VPIVSLPADHSLPYLITGTRRWQIKLNRGIFAEGPQSALAQRGIKVQPGESINMLLITSIYGGGAIGPTEDNWKALDILRCGIVDPEQGQITGKGSLTQSTASSGISEIRGGEIR